MLFWFGPRQEGQFPAKVAHEVRHANETVSTVERMAGRYGPAAACQAGRRRNPHRDAPGLGRFRRHPPARPPEGHTA
jgi:hypothetical protein